MRGYLPAPSEGIFPRGCRPSCSSGSFFKYRSMELRLILQRCVTLSHTARSAHDAPACFNATSSARYLSRRLLRKSLRLASALNEWMRSTSACASNVSCLWLITLSPLLCRTICGKAGSFPDSALCQCRLTQRGNEGALQNDLTHAEAVRKFPCR